MMIPGWKIQNLVPTTTWALLCSVLALSLCGACTTGLDDGIYKGETGSGGRVEFEIEDGQIVDKFHIQTDTDCGRTNFGLSNVSHDEGEITSKVTDKTIIRVSGEATGDTEVQGKYYVDREPQGRPECKGEGDWTAQRVGGGGGGGGGGGNTRCSCHCTCSGCSMKVTKSCPGGTCPSTCSSVCSSSCASSKCGSRRASSGSCS